jgi:catechol 2,3-dioxygenase-like lactoylglutathione lyase family enzyme
VGIVVADVEATARAWSQLLGLPMPEIRITDEFDVAQTEYEGAPTRARARMAFLNVGQLDIELLEPLGEPSTWNDQLRQHGPSMHHIAFDIAGMGEKRAYLASDGLRLIQRGEFEGGRYAYFDSQARLGAILELLEREQPAANVDEAAR